MTHEVTVHITQTDGGTYFVTGATLSNRAGHLKQRDFPDEVTLRGFLSSDVGIHGPEVEAALKVLREAPPRKQTHSIPNVMLTADQINEHGLGPV